MTLVRKGNSIPRNLSLPRRDHSAKGGPLTSSLNGGASISSMQLLYLGTDGEWLVADASVEASSTSLLAVALENGSDGNKMRVALPGNLIKDESWDWTPGSIIYVSETAGEITDTAPTGTTDAVVRIVGYALTADVIYFNPSPSYVVLD